MILLFLFFFLPYYKTPLTRVKKISMVFLFKMGLHNFFSCLNSSQHKKKWLENYLWGVLISLSWLKKRCENFASTRNMIHLGKTFFFRAKLCKNTKDLVLVCFSRFCLISIYKDILYSLYDNNFCTAEKIFCQSHFLAKPNFEW